MRFFRIVIYTGKGYNLYTEWLSINEPVEELLHYIDYVKRISEDFDIEYKDGE